jgi:hypothetical protein
LLHKAFFQQASEISLNAIEFAKLQSEGDPAHECDYCGNEIANKKVCSGCKIAVYCDRDHQKGDWKRHKLLCQRYQADARD